MDSPHTSSLWSPTKFQVYGSGVLDRIPRVNWKHRRTDPFPIAVFRRDSSRPVHVEGTHAHDFFSILLVDGGTGTVQLPGRVVRLRAGDIHMLPPGEPHDTHGLGNISGWVVEFTADAVADANGFLGVQFGRPEWFGFQYVGGVAGGKLSLPEQIRSRVAYRVESIAHELDEQGPAYQFAARVLLQLVLIDILRLATPRAALPVRLSPVVEEVFKVIDQRFAEGLSLSAVARAVGRSPSYVTNIVREQTHLTVLEWITARRLDEARRRLRQSDEDVSIVAERVGYRSVDHFIRQFRRAHGMSPGKWRHAVQGRPQRSG